MKSFTKIALLAALLLLPVSAYAATMLVAKKAGVKVLSEPKNSGATLATLKQGESIESGDRQGMFWKVKTKDGKAGFVSFMEVSRQAGGDSSALSSAIREAARDSRDMDNVKSARSRSAVMGVRGLDESQETAFAGSVKPNLRMVYAMEDRIVAQADLEKMGDMIQREIKVKSENKGLP